VILDGAAVPGLFVIIVVFHSFSPPHSLTVLLVVSDTTL
jgi:hypothetical protein